MLKPGEEEKAVLIDFDWAGEAERVRYAVTRGPELVGAEPAGLGVIQSVFQIC